MSLRVYLVRNINAPVSQPDRSLLINDNYIFFAGTLLLIDGLLGLTTNSMGDVAAALSHSRNKYIHLIFPLKKSMLVTLTKQVRGNYCI